MGYHSRPSKLKLEYQPLPPAFDPSTTQGRFKYLLYRFVALLPALFAAGFATVSCLILLWLASERRQVGIAIYRTSCSRPPWYLFPETTGEAFYTSRDFHLLPSNDALVFDADVLRDTDASQRVGVVQVCSHAHKQSWYLGQLLQNHLDFAKKWGVGYDLYTGSTSGVWAKQEAIHEKLQVELAKPPEERLSWIFYTDVDTIIVNDEVPLQSFLPPADDPAYIVISKDYSGLNAGIFFVRVCSEALEYMHRIITYDRTDPRFAWAEQSVMIHLNVAERMEERGALVAVPQDWFNSYAGEAAYAQDDAEKRGSVFQVHFPSRPRKRYEMIPFLQKLGNGELQRDPELSRKARDRLLREIKEFWEERRARRPASALPEGIAHSSATHLTDVL